MGYFAKKGLGAIRTSAITWTGGTTAVKPSQATGIASMEKIKAEWPRCTGEVTVHDNRTGETYKVPGGGGYMYQFRSGSVICSPTWSDKYYTMVKEGRSPAPKVPDLRNVRPGSADYFKWLCKAQGEGSGPHAVRMGFDRAGLKWRADTDDRMRASPYSTHKHTHSAVPAGLIMPCSMYVKNKGGNEIAWRAMADKYASEVVAAQIERDPATHTEHRPGYPGGPPLPEGDGRIFGIKPVYFVAGAVGVAVLGAALYKRGKKR